MVTLNLAKFFRGETVYLHVSFFPRGKHFAEHRQQMQHLLQAQKILQEEGYLPAKHTFRQYLDALAKYVIACKLQKAQESQTKK